MVFGMHAITRYYFEAVTGLVGCISVFDLCVIWFHSALSVLNILGRFLMLSYGRARG